LDDGGEYSDGGIQLCENVSKKANKVIKNKVVNDSFCKLKVLALNVCGLVSKLSDKAIAKALPQAPAPIILRLLVIID
jgi:hypothetical protein